jgi:hypothetical protein
MYVAIRQGHPKPGAAEEIVRLIGEEMLPCLQQLPEFGAFYLVQPGAETLVTVSVFASQTAAEESNQMVAEWARQRLVAHMAGPLELMSGEVRAHVGK